MCPLLLTPRSMPHQEAWRFPKQQSIHPSAWKGYSPKFKFAYTAFQEVRSISSRLAYTHSPHRVVRYARCVRWEGAGFFGLCVPHREGFGYEEDGRGVGLGGIGLRGAFLGLLRGTGLLDAQGESPDRRPATQHRLH